jgi:hypothetical protein
VTRFLLALYPKSWRRSYGAEFAALLEQTRLTPRVVLDVLAQGAKLHATVHRRTLEACAALLVSAGVVVVAKKMGLTANILWLPSDAARTLALLALLSPWVTVVVRARRNRALRRRAR